MDETEQKMLDALEVITPSQWMSMNENDYEMLRRKYGFPPLESPSLDVEKLR